MNSSIFSPLYELRWQQVTVVLQNRVNIYGSEHPLCIFNGIFKAACHGNRGVKKFFFRPLDTTLPNRIHKKEIYRLVITFPRASPQDCLTFLNTLEQSIYNFTIVETGSPTTGSLDILEQQHNSREWDEEICLDFLTPVSFTPKDRKRKWLIDRDSFFDRFTGRLRHFYDITLPEIHKLWQDIRLLPYYWEPFFRTHKSKSNRGIKHLNGAVGPLYLKGSIQEIAPLLLLCQEIGCGRNGAFGQGGYCIKPSRQFFDKKLYDFSLLQETVADAEKKSALADTLAATYLNIPAALKELHSSLLNDTYTPEAAPGFYVDKSGSGQRLIATLSVQDNLVHKFLHRILVRVLDRMYEEASVGFRPGRSREDAAKMIREASSEGFQYALESDIEAFFDQIDWDIMLQKISDFIPKNDLCTLELLQKAVTHPLTIKGKTVPRKKGLLQGSSLSPLLANLYLDSFDEEMAARGFRLIRYGDDFLVMTRNDEEACHALAATKEILALLKLNLKDDKTGFSSVNAGFSFLGLTFDAELSEEFVAAPSLGKTLFIKEQYIFVGIDTDSVIVRKNKLLLARFPIRRIREIVILGNSTISARLIQKCATEHIPISFCSRSGYYYSSLRPDSKYHFSRSAAHGKSHSDTDKEEARTIAARIVTAKLHNYLAWIKGRWPVESRQMAMDIENLMASLSKADSVEKIRGYEGAAAKLTFPFINHLCKDPIFHCKGRKKRQRHDRYNSLLDFAYSMLFNRLNVLLRNRGLNPYLGFLHSHRENFESLVCDLQEPFRCRIDRFVVKTINRDVIKADDFISTDHWQLNMTGEAVGRFMESFEREMDVRLAGDDGTFKQLLIAQVRSVQNWVDHGEKLRFYYAR